MSEFLVYLRLGFEHIADLKGYDHIVFIVALTAVYSLSRWKDALWLVTAFTIGHTIALATATLRLVTVNSILVEILIPITIMVVALLELRKTWIQDDSPQADKSDRKIRITRYGITLFFGLIHGLGFSAFLRAVLGSEENIIGPLFAFNLGLEFGQLAILLTIMIASYLIIQLTPVSRRIWSAFLSVSCGLIALIMLVSRLSSI